YRAPLYKQAGYKPYIIAAMIFLSKVKDPVQTLDSLIKANVKRFYTVGR
ncbi:MAG TPA: knotted carbamoyltransferase YgeW, partial [Firmicutes bacterium]|nr:knotted carbamoyltransferase YgeW [Bacillota bacterium]